MTSRSSRRDAADSLMRARDADDLGAARLVDAQTLAGILGVTRSFVYEHADELGALRLGSGPKARLRFDVERAIACLASRRSVAPEPARKTAPRWRRPRRMGTSVELLPIRGQTCDERERGGVAA